jgi:hypothetical protein
VSRFVLDNTVTMAWCVENPSRTQVFVSVRTLAGEYHLTGYDAAYLELAIRHNLPIASQTVGGYTEANAYPFHVVAPQLDERTAVTTGYANAEHAKRGCDHRGASVLLTIFTASANERPTWPAYCSRSAVFRQ